MAQFPGKPLLLALCCHLTLGVSTSLAQDTGMPAEADTRMLDTVEVTGLQNDPAMAAFRAGDYETAEVEFLENAMCALRLERSLVASFDGARIASDRADTFARSASSNSGANTRGAGAGASQDIPVGVADTTSVAARSVENTSDRTCDKRGRQLYFAGLSQVQLGKTQDALRNFERATAASKILYDAHYKIALIKLLEGDTRRAEAELAKIERILVRCRNCEARSEIIERRDHLTKAIGGEVMLR